MINNKEISELYDCGFWKYRSFIEKYLSISNDVCEIKNNYYDIYIYNISLFFTAFEKKYDTKHYRKVYESLKYCLNVAWIADQLNFSASMESEMPELIYWREMTNLFEPYKYIFRDPYSIPLFDEYEQEFLDFCSIPIVFGRTKLSECYLEMLPSILVPFQEYL